MTDGPTQDAAHRAPARQLTAAVAGGVAGGALVLLAAGRVWGRATETAATGARQTVRVTGHEALSALPALGLAALALAVVLVAARGWLRRLLGLALVVVGGAVGSMSLRSAADVTAALRRHAFGVQHVTVATGLSGWAVLAAVGGLLAVVAGGLAAVRSGGWPALGARYDAPRPRPAGDPAATAWEALDRGDDPTV